MNKKRIILLGAIAGLILVGCSSFGEKLIYHNDTYKLKNIKKVIYFQPSIFPEIEEIKSLTSQAFFSAVTDEMKQLNKNIKVVQMDHALEFEHVDTEYIKEIGENNNAEAIIVPHIKYFKVGFGKYVFSNQVLVSLKLYDQKGHLLVETEYNTYKGNGRLIGKAENSIKIGTQTAIKNLDKILKQKKILQN